MASRGAGATIGVRWSDLGLINSSAARVTSVWTGKLLARSRDGYSLEVPAYGAAFLIVQGKNGPMKRYEAAQSGSVSNRGVLVDKNAPVKFSGIRSRHAWAAIAITYTNASSKPLYAKLDVNGGAGTWIEFPPTGEHADRVWIQARLGDPKGGSVVEFSAGCQPGPQIRSLDVQ